MSELEFTADEWTYVTGRGAAALFKAGNHGQREPADLIGTVVVIDGSRYFVEGVEKWAVPIDDWRDHSIGLVVSRACETRHDQRHVGKSSSGFEGVVRSRFLGCTAGRVRLSGRPVVGARRPELQGDP